MTFNKMDNPNKSSSKAERVIGLTNYIRSPERDDTSGRIEKCIYAGARNFLTDDANTQTKEMLALAMVTVRSNDPIYHAVLSWCDGEVPNAAHIEEAVTIFLNELGLSDNQVIYGLHADTDNLHLHLAINRVHPETEKPIEINRGFDIKVGHRAAAKIERQQNWTITKHYEYDKDKVKEIRQPDAAARDMENRTGEKSAQRIAIETAAPIIKSAKSWNELHCKLANVNMRYEKTGSGAVVFVGDIGVKASNVARFASFGKLETKLGVFIPCDPQIVKPQKIAPQPLKENIPQWSDYHTSRQGYYDAAKLAKLNLDKAHEKERDELTLRHRQQRQQQLSGKNRRGRGVELNALRSVIASEQASKKADLRDKHRHEREQHRQKFPPYPAFKQWLKISVSPEVVEAWRHGDKTPLAQISGSGYRPPIAQDIRAFTPQVIGHNVFYFRRVETNVTTSATKIVPRAAFVDKGKVITVHDNKSRESVLAAMQLGVQKWGTITITGSDEYKAICVALATEHGFRIANPELQQPIERAREQIRQARMATQKPVSITTPKNKTEPATKNRTTEKLPNNMKIDKTVSPRKYTDAQTMQKDVTDDLLSKMFTVKNVTPKNTAKPVTRVQAINRELGISR